MGKIKTGKKNSIKNQMYTAARTFKWVKARYGPRAMSHDNTLGTAGYIFHIFHSRSILSLMKSDVPARTPERRVAAGNTK